MKGQATLEYIFLILFAVTIGLFFIKEFRSYFLNQPNSLKNQLLEILPFKEDQKKFDEYILYGID